MKLLSVSHHAELLGANRSLLHLLKGLQENYAVQVLVFCPAEGPFTAALREAHIPYTVKPFANWGYSLLSKKLWLFPWIWWQSKMKIVPEMIALTKEYNPDLIHSNSSLVALGWQLAENLGIPHIWHIREFGWKDYKIVFPLSLHRLYAKLNQSKHVITISHALSKKLGGRLRIPPAVVYNGIGSNMNIIKSFEDGQKRPNDGLFHFLIIGLIHPAKGQLMAIRAFKKVFEKYDNTRLIVAGKGSKIYEQLLRWQARKDGTSKAIDFCGFVHDPANIYIRSDAVLICSQHEAMGRVAAEAMSFGKPVIGYHGGAIPEIIQAGLEGNTFKSQEELSKLMIQLVENPDQSKDLSKNAFEQVTRQFSDELYVKKFYTLMINERY